MPTCGTKSSYNPKKPTGRPKTYKKTKRSCDRCFEESHGEFGESESTLSLILDEKIHFEADSSKHSRKHGIRCRIAAQRLNFKARTPRLMVVS